MTKFLEFQLKCIVNQGFLTLEQVERFKKGEGTLSEVRHAIGCVKNKCFTEAYEWLGRLEYDLMVEPNKVAKKEKVSLESLDEVARFSGMTIVHYEPFYYLIDARSHETIAKAKTLRTIARKLEQAKNDKVMSDYWAERSHDNRAIPSYWAERSPF